MLQSRPTQAREQRSENRSQRSKSYGREKSFDVSCDDNSCDVTLVGCRRQFCWQTSKREAPKSFTPEQIAEIAILAAGSRPVLTQIRRNGIERGRVSRVGQDG